MNPETEIENPNLKISDRRQKHINRLKIFGVLLTLLGVGLFSYFVYSVGLNEILEGISRIGFDGFAIVLFLYFTRIVVRAMAWNLSVYEPYKLTLRDTIPAVIMGEAMSSMIPLGILISGTSKAVAVRKKVPLVVGFASIATENLFYSLVTGIFIALGAFTFLRSFEFDEGWRITIDLLIALIILFIFLGTLMVIRQWHFASSICDSLYKRGIGASFLKEGRMQVRMFENFIYGFYRKYPKRFLPIILFQSLFHIIGIAEVWFILGRIGDAVPSFFTAVLLESVSRLITIVFKLVPFVIGVDEAGSQFVTETLAIGATIGLTLAIIRKGRILFWTAVGLLFVIKRGLSFSEITKINAENLKN